MYRVIVTLDGSELSERALELAQLLTRTLDGTLELVHVLEDPILMNVVPSIVIPDRLAAERYLREVKAKLPDDLTVSSYVLRGNAVEQLLELTHDQPDTMLVMSSHGRGGLSRIMYGSVADKVVRAATVPVAVVRATTPMHSTRLKTIVVPLDGSKLAEEALAAAIVIAEHAGATIHVVRVIDAIWRAPFVAYSPEMIPADTELMAEIESRAREEVETYLEALTESMLTHDVPIHHTMKVGQPAPEIVRAADAVSADLIVISTHGHGGVRRWALGSVTDEILHRGVTPVLVIPPKLSPASMHELQAVVAAVQ